MSWVPDGAPRRVAHHLGAGGLPARSTPPPHAFEAAGTDDADVFFVLTDAKPRFDYYRLLERVYRGEVDPAELAAPQDMYDNHYVDS